MELTGFSAKRRFEPLFSGEKLSHAYMISGPAGSGKRALAETLAAAAVCSSEGERPCGKCAHCAKSFRGLHPDIEAVRPPEGKSEINVEQVRAIRSGAPVMPNEAEKKVYIIENAGSMNQSAQNAMLKLLEEPPPSVILILIAENTAELLPTVRSRCVEIALIPPEEAAPAGEGARAAKLLAAVSGGPYAAAQFIFGLEKLQKDEFSDFLAEAREACVAELRRLESGGASELTARRLNLMTEVFSRAAEYLRANVNIGHIAGYICASLNGGADTTRK